MCNFWHCFSGKISREEFNDKLICNQYNQIMKKIIFYCLGVILMASCQMTQTIVSPPANVNVPKNALFISQSGTEHAIMQTIIDLDNNEMVVLTYNYANIANVTRTGIYLNPNDYRNMKIVGTDAPYSKEEEEKKPDHPNDTKEK